VLPEAYGTPAAVALILGGALTCFAGYRLFRVVLGIYGFVLGAMLASSTIGVNSTGAMIVAALVGGVVGSVALMLAYFVGIALVGAGLGALLANVAWNQIAAHEPPAVAVVVVSVIGAFIAMWLQRYVIVVGTAFGGAWTVIVGAVNLFAARSVGHGGSPTEVWILYPTSVGDQRWAPIAWVLLGLTGTAVQLAVTGKKK
jgi:hypothetical protein